MKYFLVFTLCLVGLSAFGSGEPLQRQAFTTNILPATIDTSLSIFTNTIGSSLLSVGNNTNVYFVRKGGNDGTAIPNDQNFPYLTLFNANAAATTAFGAGRTNNLIDIGVGVFDETTNQTVLTNGTCIRGAGRFSSIINFECTNNNNLCIALA